MKSALKRQICSFTELFVMKLIVNENMTSSAGCIQVLTVDQPERLFLIDRFNTEEEALAIANASNVGLAGESVPLSMNE